MRLTFRIRVSNADPNTRPGADDLVSDVSIRPNAVPNHRQLSHHAQALYKINDKDEKSMQCSRGWGWVEGHEHERELRRAWIRRRLALGWRRERVYMKPATAAAPPLSRCIPSM